ncbi:hypothetical protein SAMN05421543_101463 [Alicyclobacillus macrosporangiidus]|jgi:hypothetical protein|uniref:Uncharacterized protein n=1 Tax=Alicyclobacillus macrosporangiidus TaxID=392015 RepID=A0A1I7FUP5_9BACL|nr:hypothetical protein SAMN05421543_101463 [Alicyclobacillus macrosporangiidus]
MGRRKKKIVRWHLLWRMEEGQRVWVYEPLTFSDLNSRLRDGWHVIGLDRD